MTEEMTEEKKLVEAFLSAHGLTKTKGFAISNNFIPEDYEEILFSGESLEEAFKGYFRRTSFWYVNECPEQVFEDEDEAIEYVEDKFDVEFDKFKEKPQ